MHKAAAACVVRDSRPENRSKEWMSPRRHANGRYSAAAAAAAAEKAAERHLIDGWMQAGWPVGRS